MDIPQTIVGFFDADNRDDIEAMVQTFSPTARVKDEGADHHGAEAISKWLRNAKQKTPYIAEPLDAKADGDRIFVRAKVSGAFPSSPITLSYAFQLEDGKIAELEIK